MAAKKKRTVVDVAEIGSLGGLARAANLSPEQRKAAARKAINARWDAYYEAHPEKLKARLEREARKGTTKRGRPPKKKGAK
jgi:hypothetical protein